MVEFTRLFIITLFKGAYSHRIISSVILVIFLKAMPLKAQERHENLEGSWRATDGRKLVFPADFNNLPVVFFFLSPECPLCINYNAVLNALQERYEGKVKIYGIFSGSFYKTGAINEYAKKYQIRFPLLIDAKFMMASKLRAEITPECVLLDQYGFVRYTGAIDNRAPVLGTFKNQASIHYLAEAIEAVLVGKPVQIKHIKPNGCFIYP